MQFKTAGLFKILQFALPPVGDRIFFQIPENLCFHNEKHCSKSKIIVNQLFSIMFLWLIVKFLQSPGTKFRRAFAYLSFCPPANCPFLFAYGRLSSNSISFFGIIRQLSVVEANWRKLLTFSLSLLKKLRWKEYFLNFCAYLDEKQMERAINMII